MSGQFGESPSSPADIARRLQAEGALSDVSRLTIVETDSGLTVAALTKLLLPEEKPVTQALTLSVASFVLKTGTLAIEAHTFQTNFTPEGQPDVIVAPCMIGPVCAMFSTETGAGKVTRFHGDSSTSMSSEEFWAMVQSPDAVSDPVYLAMLTRPEPGTDVFDPTNTKTMQYAQAVLGAGHDLRSPAAREAFRIGTAMNPAAPTIPGHVGPLAIAP